MVNVVKHDYIPRLCNYLFVLSIFKGVLPGVNFTNIQCRSNPRTYGSTFPKEPLMFVVYTCSSAWSYN